MFSIGQHFNLSVAELREANPNVGSTIFVGQVLNIPARILFVTGGTSAIVQGQLGANSKQYYLLNAGAGQTLEVTLTAPSGLTLAILGADGSTVQSASSNLIFRGVLPKTQDYILVLASGSSATNFGMSAGNPTAHSLCRWRNIRHPHRHGSRQPQPVFHPAMLPRARP